MEGEALNRGVDMLRFPRRFTGEPHFKALESEIGFTLPSRGSRGSVIIPIILSMALIYLLATLGVLYLVHHYPRQSVQEAPDWGVVQDARIPTVEGGTLEVWRVDPEGESRGIVLLAHGWGRNRDRMVARARLLGRWGYTTVMHSARDHGHSSPRRWMNAARFAEDIEAVMRWLDAPVILYGHSAGSAGAAVAASHHPGKVRALILEASYARARPALISLYTWYHVAFGLLFARAVLLWMAIMYRGTMKQFDPARLAPHLTMPVMLIHGEKDRRFPLAFARELQAAFEPRQIPLFVAPGADHSDSSLSPGYADALKRFLDGLEPPFSAK